MKRACILGTFIAMALSGTLIACSSGQPPAVSPTAPVVAAKTEAPKPAWQQQWDKVVAEAKKEGVVSIASNWGPTPRDAVIKAMETNYGIDAEISSAGASQQAEKILTERRAGLYNYDIAVQGSNFGINLIKPAKGFDPADSALILPEVTDPRNWLGGAFPWFDKDHTMIPFFGRLDTNLAINTELVKPGEITSYKDLLDPKWKGKIMMSDPTVVGSGSGWARENGRDLGLDYMRALAKQEPAISSNERQLAEWLARGKYPILVAGNSDSLNSMVTQGAPIALLDAKDSRTIGPSSGIVALFNKPAHPNAAKLFMNWILTKEGQTIMTRSVGLPSRRLDAPTDHLEKNTIPQPGRKYTEYTEESVAGDAEALKNSKEIFGPLLGK